MKFCEKCGAYMRGTPNGLVCTRCGNTVQTEIPQVRSIEQPETTPIEVVDDSKLESAKVAETCPTCGNGEAFRNISFISGEHAGVRQERSMERFTCTKCGHSWTKN